MYTILFVIVIVGLSVIVTFIKGARNANDISLKYMQLCTPDYLISIKYALDITDVKMKCCGNGLIVLLITTLAQLLLF